MSTTFNEATRVQMPALVHLSRLGYSYFGKITEESAGKVFDPDTNILIDVFKSQFAKLNPEHEGEAEQALKDIRQELDNDDLGRSFYKRLTSVSPVKLIDFENINNNLFHYTAEFTCKRDQDNFRPDITLFINGLPLVFIEVKKPNNSQGMIAESERMNNTRFPNKKFRRFINITQIMIFSNNMEYDAAGGIVPIQGAFYCTTARKKAFFNCFREENPANLPIAPYIEDYPYREIPSEIEHKILSDFNCQVIRSTPEYQTNLNKNTPTNRIITSICSPERLLFLLNYGIAYVKNEKEDEDGKIISTDEKHIMRYQQMFAALAIKENLKKGIKSGVVWHTQGSGKTALAYYLNNLLTDFFAKFNKVAKFYFIVDRLDLLKQATQEFEARGLTVKTANSRKELMEQFRTLHALEGNSGQREVTVINIQRFAEDKEKVELPPYATNLQRIFIVDEAHRGYNPKGAFLANLFESDKNAIKIALTGTPLLKEERASWKIFGNYFHTYYYDKSVRDGYTLKIIREDIETSYRERLSKIYEKLETLVQKKEIKKADIIEHDSYVKELIRFIITDFKKFRIYRNDKTLGGMIICETSGQARKIYDLFQEIQNELNLITKDKSNFKVGLILYDSDDKETQDKIINNFKKNMTIDILIVYNMLLTGFDAPRLKKLYLGRQLTDHNLLQAITRVNRPYKDNRYGFVVDFADIKKNFEKTNEDYLKELNRFNDPDETGEGNNTNTFVQILEDPKALENKMRDLRQTLFSYSIDNSEAFSAEIANEEDKEKLIELKKALLMVRDCCNLVRTFGDKELKASFAKFELPKVSEMISEIQNRISNINLKEVFYRSDETLELINDAMNDISFDFRKIGEEEMKLVSGGLELQQKWSDTISCFTANIDKEDPEYISLWEAFMKRFKEHGFTIKSVLEFNEHSKALDEVLKKLADIQRKNNALLSKYNDDEKYVRVHKRIREENEERKKASKPLIISKYDEDILHTLLSIKSEIDQKVYDRNDIINKDAYFEQTVMTLIKQGLNANNINSERDDRVFIKNKISQQYLNQYKSLQVCF